MIDIKLHIQTYTQAGQVSKRCSLNGNELQEMQNDHTVKKAAMRSNEKQDPQVQGD